MESRATHVRSRKSRRRKYTLAFKGPGRPTDLTRMIELAKMAWSPVLELLGREDKFVELDAEPYELTDPPSLLGSPESVLELARKEGPTESALRWLTTTDVIEVHDEMIREFGGESGVLDAGRIDSALQLSLTSPVRGHHPYPSILHKAAHLLHSILVYHPFVDGQKRTGISTAFILLGVNGYHLWSRDFMDEVHFAIHVAKGEFEVPEIARWLAGRVVSPNILRNQSIIEVLLPLAEQRRRQCPICRRLLRLDRYHVTCEKCRSEFEVRINAALIPWKGRGSRFVVRVGLKLLTAPRSAESEGSGA